MGCVLSVRDRHSTLNRTSACNVLRRQDASCCSFDACRNAGAAEGGQLYVSLAPITDVQVISFDVMQGQPTSLTALALTLITDPGDVGRVRHSLWLDQNMASGDDGLVEG